MLPSGASRAHRLPLAPWLAPPGLPAAPAPRFLRELGAGRRAAARLEFFDFIMFLDLFDLLYKDFK